MNCKNLRALLSQIHNEVLAPGAPSVEPKDIKLNELGIDIDTLKQVEVVLVANPYFIDAYVNKLIRSIHPLTDLAVDAYVEHLGVAR